MHLAGILKRCKEKVNSELLEDRWIFSALVKLLPRTSPRTACGVGRLCSLLEFKAQSSPSAKRSLWTELLSQGPEPCLRRDKLCPAVVSLGGMGISCTPNELPC